ncbi:MAG: hypothetical protein E7544_05130 [Ruminococcaceae bacterium]|nr:hypothetical protein [Oscillospiraceae bacterium]
MKRSVSLSLKIVATIILVCIVFAGFLILNDNIGIAPEKLEADIRSSQKIADDWIVEGYVSDTMAAYISYPADKSDCTFSVYVKRDDLLSFGYFFRSGGSIYEIEEHIAEHTVNGCNERAFLSMNRQKVARLEVNNGISVEVTEIDSDKPFAIVLPMNAGSITFYDINGKAVEYY